LFRPPPGFGSLYYFSPKNLLVNVCPGPLMRNFTQNRYPYRYHPNHLCENSHKITPHSVFMRPFVRNLTQNPSPYLFPRVHECKISFKSSLRSHSHSNDTLSKRFAVQTIRRSESTRPDISPFSAKNTCGNGHYSCSRSK